MEAKATDWIKEGRAAYVDMAGEWVPIVVAEVVRLPHDRIRVRVVQEGDGDAFGWWCVGRLELKPR